MCSDYSFLAILLRHCRMTNNTPRSGGRLDLSGDEPDHRAIAEDDAPWRSIFSVQNISREKMGLGLRGRRPIGSAAELSLVGDVAYPQFSNSVWLAIISLEARTRYQVGSRAIADVKAPEEFNSGMRRKSCTSGNRTIGVGDCRRPGARAARASPLPPSPIAPVHSSLNTRPTSTSATGCNPNWGAHLRRLAGAAPHKQEP